VPYSDMESVCGSVRADFHRASEGVLTDAPKSSSLTRRGRPGNSASTEPFRRAFSPFQSSDLAIGTGFPDTLASKLAATVSRESAQGSMLYDELASLMSSRARLSAVLASVLASASGFRV